MEFEMAKVFSFSFVFLFFCVGGNCFLKAEQSSELVYPAAVLKELGFSVEKFEDIGLVGLLAKHSSFAGKLEVQFRYGIKLLWAEGHMYRLQFPPENALYGLALKKEDAALFRELAVFYLEKIRANIQPPEIQPPEIQPPKKFSDELSEETLQASVSEKKQNIEPPWLRGAGVLPLSKKTAEPGLSQKNEGLKLVIIDPGHGGRDPGAVFFAYKEKTLVLRYAKQLQRELRKKLPLLRVILTRTRDEYVSLAERSRRAHKSLAEGENALFISLHLNAWPSPYVRGFELYYLKVDERLSQQRVHYHLKNFPFKVDEEEEVKKIFSYFTTTQYQWESKFFAEGLLQLLQMNISDYALNSELAKSDNFYVLRSVIMPAVLLELGFISNEEDLKFLLDKEKRRRLLSEISLGILSYDKTLKETQNFSLNPFLKSNE